MSDTSVADDSGIGTSRKPSVAQPQSLKQGCEALNTTPCRAMHVPCPSPGKCGAPIKWPPLPDTVPVSPKTCCKGSELGDLCCAKNNSCSERKYTSACPPPQYPMPCPPPCPPLCPPSPCPPSPCPPSPCPPSPCPPCWPCPPACSPSCPPKCCPPATVCRAEFPSPTLLPPPCSPPTIPRACFPPTCSPPPCFPPLCCSPPPCPPACSPPCPLPTPCCPPACSSPCPLPAPCCPPACSSPCPPPAPCCPPACPPCYPCVPPPTLKECPSSVCPPCYPFNCYPPACCPADPEVERPRNYDEMISGKESWAKKGIRIAQTDPPVPGDSTLVPYQPIFLTLTVEAKDTEDIQPECLGAYCWTHIMTSDNPCGIWRDLRMSYDPWSSDPCRKNIQKFVFRGSITPVCCNNSRLTFNIKYGTHMIWANDWQIDNVVAPDCVCE